MIHYLFPLCPQPLLVIRHSAPPANMQTLLTTQSAFVAKDFEAGKFIPENLINFDWPRCSSEIELIIKRVMVVKK